MATRENQADHDRMVKAIADYCAKNGHKNIRVDLPGFEAPLALTWKGATSGYVPDVTSESGSGYIFEVETADSIEDEHTQDQWKLFAANARQYSKKFIVVVPKGHEAKAKARAKALGIALTDVWTVG